MHRQDVRDLVELTVDRMDVYHLVPFCMYWLLSARQSASYCIHTCASCFAPTFMLLQSCLLASTSGGSAFLGILHCALLWRPSAGWDSHKHTNVFLAKLAKEMQWWILLQKRNVGVEYSSSHWCFLSFHSYLAESPGISSTFLTVAVLAVQRVCVHLLAAGGLAQYARSRLRNCMEELDEDQKEQLRLEHIFFK